MGKRVWGALPLLAVLWLVQCAPGDGASDTNQLRALHEKVMEAHRQSKPELLLEDEAADYIVAGRGEVTYPKLEERTQRFQSYLGRTSFHEYRDLIEPIVSVSDDGTMAWVVVQVQARGIQSNESGESEPVEFVSAWIELYRKQNDRWWRVGNVSNFRS